MLIRKWAIRIHIVIQAHHESAAFFRRIHYIIGIPLVCMSGVLGTSTFSNISNSENHLSQIVTGTLGVVVTILAALQTFLKLDQKAILHENAANKFSNVMRLCEITLAQVSNNNYDDKRAEKELRIISSLMDRAIQNSPSIPQHIWKPINNKAWKVLEENGQVK